MDRENVGIRIMLIVKPGCKILSSTPELERMIERAGRTCYKSEDRISESSSRSFVQSLILRGHESVLEHGAISVRFVCDRGVSHELVRHRLASFSQESTRYCNYANGGGLTFVEPCYWPPGHALRSHWEQTCTHLESAYMNAMALGATAEEARALLPSSLKTEVVMTANPREWRHVFKLRCDKAAHPQIRELMIPLSQHFRSLWPYIFPEVYLYPERRLEEDCHV